MSTENPRNVREVMRDEMVMRERIVTIMRDGSRTVPEVAEELGTPTNETMLWMMAMRRYGMLIEQGRPNEDGYFNYVLTNEAAQ